MTHEEEIDILLEVVRLREAGDNDAATAMFRKYPLPPNLAKISKEVYGSEFLIKNGYNLSKAEAEYGKNWLN